MAVAKVVRVSLTRLYDVQTSYKRCLYDYGIKSGCKMPLPGK